MIHELKIWPEFFEAVKDGSKTFEVRVDDRDFKEGDGVFLREWNPETKKYTGSNLRFNIGYVYRIYQIKYVAFSLVEVEKHENRVKRQQDYRVKVQKVLDHDKRKGYPTGPEWNELIKYLSQP